MEFSTSFITRNPHELSPYKFGAHAGAGANTLFGVGLDRNPDSFNQTSITVNPTTPGYLTMEPNNPWTKHGDSEILFFHGA
jgi:hypothetical protein